MPVAAIDPNEYIRVDLKTCPPDGFVMLRPLPYGEKIKRRDKTSKMLMKTSQKSGSGRGRMNLQNLDAVMEFESAQEWAMQFDFAYCIGEHNLQNKDGSPMDFSKPLGWKLLDPRIGDEIAEAIFAMNELEDEEDLEDFPRLSSTSLEARENGSGTVLQGKTEEGSLKIP